MNDRETTLMELKKAVRTLVLKKGWGVDGVQNPQHVAMAMTVEMSELLEHFQWMEPEEVDALLAGRRPEKTRLIAEEFADVMIYGLQLAHALNFDIAAEIERKLDIVDHRPARKDDARR